MMLHQLLGALEQEGLIHPVAHKNEIEYDFRHELIHATAYSMLLKSERRSLHLAVGEVIEEQTSDLIPQRAALIARHFDEAGEEERALRYYTQAGDDAAHQYANGEAILNYKRALEIAQKSEQNRDLLRKLYLNLGRELELNGRYREALDTYHQMQVYARLNQEAELEFSALMAHAKIYATPNPEHNPTLAKKLLGEALEFTQKTGNRADEAHVLWNLLVLAVYSGGDFGQAIQWGERALALARSHNLEELTAFILNDLVYAYFGSGQTPLAQETQREAADLWRKLGNLPMLVDCLSISIPIDYLLGEYEGALKGSKEALELSKQTGNEWGQAGSLAFTGLVYHEFGQIDLAMETYQQAFELGIKTRHPGAYIASRCCANWLLADMGKSKDAIAALNKTYQEAIASGIWHLPVWALIMLSQVHLRNKDIEHAQDALQSLRQIDRPAGLRWFVPIFAPLSESEIMLTQKDYSGALETIELLLGYLERTKTITFIPDALRLKAKAQAELGEEDKAYSTLLQARQISEELGSRRTIWPILGDLSDLSKEKGQVSKAVQYREDAREVLEYILDHTSNTELRRSFTNRPKVRALMGS